jgi:hypothetical protein
MSPHGRTSSSPGAAWPPGKIATRHLAPYLLRCEEAELMADDPKPVR